MLPTTVWPSEVFRIATGRARFGGGGGGGGSIPGEKNCGNFVGLFTVGVEGLDWNLKKGKQKNTIEKINK